MIKAKKLKERATLEEIKAKFMAYHRQHESKLCKQCRDFDLEREIGGTTCRILDIRRSLWD